MTLRHELLPFWPFLKVKLRPMFELFNTTTTTLNSLLGVLLWCMQLLGAGLVVVGLIGLARPSHHNGAPNAVWSSIKNIVVGSLLIILIKVLDVTSMSLLDQTSRSVLDNTLLPGSSLGQGPQYLMGVVFAVVTTVGFFAFARGWWLLRAPQGSQGVGRGLVFIVAGTLAINLDVAMQMTARTVAQFNPDLAAMILMFTPT